MAFFLLWGPVLKRFSILLFPAVSILLYACVKDSTPTTLFTEVLAKNSGIDFSNDLTFTESYNPYIFKNFLNGGGVAAGDINNDGLPDLFFCGNMVSNKLYLNEGNLKFKDITAKAGVGTTEVWSTGVSMVDINGDGWLDIYVCKSGKPDAPKRHNELFINNGDLTFTEVSQQAGIADVGLSTHAAFFDYDRDGDLDCYLLNNSLRSVGNYDLEKDSRLQRDTMGGNKLYRNDLIQLVNGEMKKNTTLEFTDVSDAAGIYGSAIGFGLGVTVADLNGDHWPDLYVSNDFFERDYLYINQQNGTFRECLTDAMAEISMGSMGADIADLNEDGWPEIFVTEMLPKEPLRYKTKAVFEHWHKYQQAVGAGYHQQFGRNVLQLHRGLGPDTLPVFSEIGRAMDVHATEWSWGALLADFNNDGRKDIFVANGIYKDLIDMDYVNFYFNPDAVRALIKSKKEVITTMFDAAESVKMPNQLFLQDSTFHFSESSAASGIGVPTFSNGSSYADLDNDGDLEVILNNVNMPAMIFENHASQQGAHFIRIKLQGTGMNTGAIGSKVTVYACGLPHHIEVNPMRGFQSGVDPVVTVGLGQCERIDSVRIIWPLGKETILRAMDTDTTLVIRENNLKQNHTIATTVSTPLLIHSTISLPYTHIENRFSDFDRDRLMFFMTSNEGPRAGVADLDNDGLEDIVIGGAHGQPTGVLFQENNGSFTRIESADIVKDSLSEDISILLSDVNCDDKIDIYISSGGSELPASSSAMRDRLYLNLGSRKFIAAKDFFHPSFESHHAACIADFDGDKDRDLAVFSRLIPFAYGVPAPGHIFFNEKCSSWMGVSKESEPFTPGLVTSAVAADMDGDGDEDIVASYEYGPVRIFTNEQGKFSDISHSMHGITGMWKNIAVTDIEHDGDMDIIACNHGLNSRLKATEDAPLVLYVNDFDRNGQTEQILCWRRNGVDYPVAMKDDLLKQMPFLNKKYTTYKAFAAATIQDMFDAELVEKSIIYYINELRSGIFYNDHDSFRFAPLPDDAQMTTQYASWTGDINGDGRMDIILGGNQYNAKPEMGINAASYGNVLIQNVDQTFTSLTFQDSGLFEKGSIRYISTITIGSKKYLLVIKNNDSPSLYTFQFPATPSNRLLQ